MLAETFPSSQRRGGCAERSDGADGVVRPAKASRRTDHPGLRPPLLCEEGNILFAFRRRVIMKFGKRTLITLAGVGLLGGLFVRNASTQSHARPTIATDADFRQAMQELSNWGRWGEKDELGAANLITPAKRKQALALAKDGTTISLAHD